jgi:hypothetical protein
MAAAPYKVSLIAAKGSPSGLRKIFPLTASDVNGEFWLFPSGSSEITLNGSEDVYLVDAIYSASGTDTTQVEFYINGMAEGTKLLNATSLATTIVRPLSQSPLRVPKGATFKAKQLT